MSVSLARTHLTHQELGLPRHSRLISLTWQPQIGQPMASTHPVGHQPSPPEGPHPFSFCSNCHENIHLHRNQVVFCRPLPSHDLFSFLFSLPLSHCRAREALASPFQDHPRDCLSPARHIHHARANSAFDITNLLREWAQSFLAHHRSL